MPSVRAGEVRRAQDHFAEPSAGRSRDPAAFHHRLQVLEDERHGLLAPREDRVADESHAPFDDRRFGMHVASTYFIEDDKSSRPPRIAKSKSYTEPSGLASGSCSV